MAAFTSSVRELRTRAGVQQRELAARAGISRQSLGLIEAGETVPSTAIALALAAALGCTVEDLFSLPVAADVLPARAVEATPPGARVRLGLVDDAWVAHPLGCDMAALTPADGLVARVRRADVVEVRPLRSANELHDNILAAGCDPALGLLSGHLASGAARVQLHWIHLSSEAALQALQDGQVHVAGVHLHGGAGEDHVALVQRCFAGREMVVVTLAAWQQGLVARPERLHRLRGVDALAGRGIKMAVREPGSGARALLDRLLGGIGARSPSIDVVAPLRSHHAVARAIAEGHADVGVATEAAAAAFGLGFHALVDDRFDLVMTAETAARRGGQRLLDVLTSARFRDDAGALPGYLTTATGQVVARLPA